MGRICDRYCQRSCPRLRSDNRTDTGGCSLISHRFRKGRRFWGRGDPGWASAILCGLSESVGNLERFVEFPPIQRGPQIFGGRGDPGWLLRFSAVFLNLWGTLSGLLISHRFREGRRFLGRGDPGWASAILCGLSESVGNLERFVEFPPIQRGPQIFGGRGDPGWASAILCGLSESVGNPERFVEFPPIQRGPQIFGVRGDPGWASCDSLWSF